MSTLQRLVAFVSSFFRSPHMVGRASESQEGHAVQDGGRREAGPPVPNSPHLTSAGQPQSVGKSVAEPASRDVKQIPENHVATKSWSTRLKGIGIALWMAVMRLSAAYAEDAPPEQRITMSARAEPLQNSASSSQLQVTGKPTWAIASSGSVEMVINRPTETIQIKVEHITDGEIARIVDDVVKAEAQKPSPAEMHEAKAVLKSTVDEAHAKVEHQPGKLIDESEKEVVTVFVGGLAIMGRKWVFHEIADALQRAAERLHSRLLSSLAKKFKREAKGHDNE